MKDGRILSAIDRGCRDASFILDHTKKRSAVIRVLGSRYSPYMASFEKVQNPPYMDGNVSY